MFTIVKIADYFNEKQQAAAEEKASLGEAIEQAEKLRKQLTLDIKKKKQLIAENAAEGVDTGTLTKKVEDLEQQVSELATEIRALRTRAEAPDPEPPFDFRRAQLLAQLLAQHGCAEALEICELEECIPLLPVGIRLVTPDRHGPELSYLAARGLLGVVVDGAGRPIWCSVGISSDLSLPVPVKPSNGHYFAGYRPPLLEWLPPDDSRERDDENDENDDAAVVEATGAKFLAFLDRRGGRLLLSKVHFEVPVEEIKYNQETYKYNQETYLRERVFRSERCDFSDLATSLYEYLAEMLSAAGGILDMNTDYPDNPLMAHIKSRLLPVTTPSPRFRPCTERLRSEEIARRIKADWDAFVQAPWSGAITGSLAAAKHLLESGERPRFWNEAFEGAYGFRLRTRDHDWVLGKIFIAADGSPGSNEDDIRIHDVPGANRYGAEKTVQIATHGRMSIRLHRESDPSK